MSTAETYTIGKVVKRLSATYPDLTVSKVRFLESEGLLKPQRTKSGYRLYSDDDVRRLETVLRLQSRYFYPLSVIKERLESMDSDAVIDEDGLFSQAPTDEPTAFNGPISLEDAPAMIGVSVAFVRSLADNGLIHITNVSFGHQSFDGSDVPLIRAAAELKAYGIDPRFLKPYVQRANRDVPLFKQALSTQIGRFGGLEDVRTRREFDDMLEHLIQLTNRVGECIVRREVRAEFNYPDE